MCFICWYLLFFFQAFQDLTKLIEKAKEMVTMSTNIASKIKDKKGDITDDEVSLTLSLRDDFFACCCIYLISNFTLLSLRKIVCYSKAGNSLKTLLND